MRLYQSGLPENEILKRRAPIFVEINQDYARLKPTLSGLERFDLDREKLNNAVLLNYLLYFHDTANFAALERLNHGDLEADDQADYRTRQEPPRRSLLCDLWRATLTAPPPTGERLPSATAPASSTAPLAATPVITRSKRAPSLLTLRWCVAPPTRLHASAGVRSLTRSW